MVLEKEQAGDHGDENPPKKIPHFEDRVPGKMVPLPDPALGGEPGQRGHGQNESLAGEF